MSDLLQERLRADAEAILRAGIAGAAPGPLVQRALARHRLPGPVHLLAVGKAAIPMARAAYALAPVRTGLVVAPALDELPWPAPAPRLLPADHPMPTQRSVNAGLAVYHFLEQLTADDTAVVLLSGGGSALMTLPAAGLTLHDLAATTRVLLTAGADIQDLNCVRRHLDDVKGGRLARVAAPGTVLCLALSDVPGDDPRTIASGPFSPDGTSAADALAVLHRHGVLDRVPAAVRRHLEAPGTESLAAEDASFDRVRYEIIGSNREAREAAALEARRRGYVARVPDGWLTGEARLVGQRLAGGVVARSATLAEAVVYGGETTVTVRGPGVGGRNQELALAAALVLAGRSGVALGAAGTDGIDGVSPAAGAIVDGATADRARAAGCDPDRALAENDSYPALAAAGAALLTGATGTNVMDLAVTLAAPLG